MSAIWTAEREVLPEGRGEKLVILRNGSAASFSEVIAGWQESAECRALFVDALAITRFAAFFWEMPPIVRGRMERAYECVLLPAEALAGLEPEPHAYAAKFVTTEETVTTFANLGGDALLVVPRQIGAAEAYAHLAAFVRAAPAAQRHDFLRVLGRAADCELKSRAGRIWISTSGLGVAWLHARLDSSPKYYQHPPYKAG